MLRIGAIASKVLGAASDRKVEAYRPKVEQINELEPELERLSDADLRARTEAFRKTPAAAGVGDFPVCSAASRRRLDVRNR